MYFLVDTHVHIYANYHLPSLLNVAVKNFRHWQSSIGKKFSLEQEKINDCCHVLLLTETVNDDAFSQLQKMANDKTCLEGWCFQSKSDSVVVATQENDDVNSICIVVGQQVISAENLELSIWGSVDKTQEKKKASVIIEHALASGDSVGVPWGVAKWVGPRGQIVLDLMNEYGGTIALSDNSGRPVFWLNPQHFKLARHKNISVFAGSDVLPVDGGEAKVARYISVFNSENTLESKDDLKSILSSHIGNVGSLASPSEFFKDQMAMQLRKRSK